MRLIDADELQRRICGAKCGCEYEDCANEGDCGYDFFIFHAKTVDTVPKEDYQKLLDLLDDLSEITPSCIGCDGKKTNGERTEKCFYRKLSVTDNQKIYCIKRGIENIHNILKENELLRQNTVSKCLYDQIKWERDVAVNQLHSYGIEFGEKVDVKKVEHGKWNVEKGFYGLEGYRCSECGKEVDVWKEYVYCPHCGAKNDYEEK